MSLDAAILGLGGVAAAQCGARARSIPIYMAATIAALLQAATVPLVLGVLAVVAAFARGSLRRRSHLGAVAGGLTWAATVGAPFEPGARLVWLPVGALAWTALSARRHGGRRFRQRFDRAATAVGALAVVGAGLGGVAVLDARSHLDRGNDLLRSGLDAARLGDTDTAITDLRGARDALRRGERSLGAPWARPAWAVPGVSQNLRVLHRAVGEVADLAAIGVTAADEADLSSLQVQGGRIDLTAVTAMERPLLDVLHQLRASHTTVGRLAGQWLLPPVTDRLADVEDELADAIPSTELAIEGVRTAPGLLGGDGPRSYLVLFTTPVEARATTGFPGNFAEITFTDGRFDMTRFGRISELIYGGLSSERTLSGPPDFLARYARWGPAWDWRNITLSPDFPTVATVAAELYPQSGGRAIDGVMSVDPTALAALLRFTGPVAVPGVARPLTHRNAERFLLRDQYVDLPDTPERIDALEQLAEITFERLTTSNLPGPRELGRVLGPVVEEGHLQVVAFGDEPLAFLDRLGISGRYPAVRGDFVGVTTSNAAGSKIDLFARRALDYQVRWDPSTGALRATATIVLSNDAPSSGLPDYVIGNVLGRHPLEEKLPDGWNNSLVTLYTPWDATAVTLDGAPILLERIDELGRHALTTFVAIPPGGRRTLVVELEGVLAERAYRLDLAPQPQVTPEQVRVEVQLAGGDPVRVSGPVRVRGFRAAGELPLVKDVTIRVRAR